MLVDSKAPGKDVCAYLPQPDETLLADNENISHYRVNGFHM